MIIIMHQTYNKVQKLPKLRIVLSKLTILIPYALTGNGAIVFHELDPLTKISVELRELKLSVIPATTRNT